MRSSKALLFGRATAVYRDLPNHGTIKLRHGGDGNRRSGGTSQGTVMVMVFLKVGIVGGGFCATRLRRHFGAIHSRNP
jgi:hypothetical protein